MRLPLPRKAALSAIISGLFTLPLLAAEPTPSIDNAAVAWRFQTGKEVTAAPVVAGGVVYCGSTNGRFFALDAGTGRELWKFNAPFPISTRAALTDDLVCIVSGNTLHALDRKTGAPRWAFTAKPYRPIFSMDLTDYHRSSPVISGGIAYFGDDWGNLNGVLLTDGSLAFQYTTPAGRPIRSTPAIHEGAAYFGDWEGDVFAVSLADRTLRWKHTLENVRPYYGAIVSEFLIHEGVVYFGSQHDIFTPLDAATGRPVWRHADEKHTYLPSTPVLHDGRVIIATTIFTHSVLCLDQGKTVWACKLSGIFFTKPVVAPPVLIINSTDFGKTGHLYLIDLQTGTLVHNLPIERAAPSAPALADGRVFIGAGDGCLYALRLDALQGPTTKPTAP